jgi:hypothetical protein
MHEKSTLTENSFPPRVPAPWTLKGEGIILIYHFKKSWVEKYAHLPQNLKGKFKGGLGYVMLVNYLESPVGPYRELLIIPGKFHNSGLQSITKIFVDSEASTFNGRENWGIPKETLPFSWGTNIGEDLISISSGNREIFSAEISHGGIPFPVSTSLLPLRLGQILGKTGFITKPHGSGWGKLAKVKKLVLDPEFFPDIRLVRPLLAVKVNPFTIHFPTPTYAAEKVF